MRFNDNIKVYGDKTYRGDCPKEAMEQATFFNRLRKEYPDTLGCIATHVKNEGMRQGWQAKRDHSQGMTKGASDIVIPASPAFVCEVKRKDHTKSKWQDGQQEYLETAEKLGAFACLALGADGAWEAFHDYLQKYYK